MKLLRLWAVVVLSDDLRQTQAGTAGQEASFEALPTNDLPDHEGLMKAHFNGDPAAFPQLFEHYRHDLWCFLRYRMNSRHDAEDLFQDVCLKVFNKLDTLKDPNAFRSWLFAIAANAVRSFFRGRKKVVSLDRNYEDEDLPRFELAEEGPDAFRSLHVKREVQLLRECLVRLSERDREILLLDTVAEIPQREIADMFDMNLNTVKTIIRRARIKLARAMAEAEHDGQA
ncbi:RNA polymerase sigma factor [Sulfidibacter corallicola]|uniref:RNA polymerase sigma factor n=1 Tax=Sulfidibacter corallicola TaxID=2818388 RepID=A0A8A4TE83_SULCO|nr:RNA polymerase sigma factor [Sulfidibacter corallicola]QTD47534.1 RNA polymerase sigma factor [Sulfidibacter corallicola]